MSTTDFSTGKPSSKQGVVPTNIEEGEDPFRLTSAAPAQEGSFAEADAVPEHTDAASGSLQEVGGFAANKKEVFKEAAEEVVKLQLVVPMLQEYIKRTRFLKMRHQPKEYYVRQQACMVGFLFYTRVKKQRLGYKDIRELFVNLFDLHDYCLKGSPKTAASVLLRLIYRLLIIMCDVAKTIELASNVRATDWSSLATVCRTKHSGREKGSPHFNVKSIMPVTSHFETLHILGQGGFGVVTRVVFGGILDVAVKMVPLDKQILPKYAVVDKVAACMVNHPLIMKYYCTFRSTDAHVTVMEFIHAVDLLEVVNEFSKQQLMPLKVKQHIVSQLCLALTHLHFKGLIHRDLKPSNIMLVHGCRVKLFDFDTVKIGMGKFSNRPMHNFYARTSTEFLDRETAGTIYFFPPETLLKRSYGRCIDWWALGITLFEMAFGYLPFRAAERPVLKDLIKSGSYTFPKYAQLDSPEVKFIERCLQRNPMRRLCASDYNEFRMHEYLNETNWSQVEVTTTINWTGVEHLLKKHSRGAKREAKFQNSKLASLPFIETTNCDPNSPPLYTFTSTNFLNVMEKLHSPKSVIVEDAPELIQLDVVQRYRFKEYLL